MTTGTPFTPLVKVEGGAGGPGRMQVTVDEDGVPFWQGGDLDPRWFAVSSVGSFSGNVSSMRTYDDVHGWAYVTGARVLVVASDFAKGSRYRAVGVPSLSNLTYMAVANRASKSRARKAAAGQFLAGQVRLPWVGHVVWAPPSMPRRLRGQIRVIGTHRTVFGDQESVGLCFRLADPGEVVPLVTLLVERVQADRMEHEQTSADHRSELAAIRPPVSVNTTSPDTLASLKLPGNWVVTAGSAFLGSVSAASADVMA